MTDFPGSTIASPGTTVGPGGAAPANALYLVLATTPLLTDERVFTAGIGLTSVDAGAGSTFTVTADLSTGISGGQAAIGGTDAGDDLTLRATSNATDGDIIFESDPTTEVARFVSSGEFLVGTAANPSSRFVLFDRSTAGVVNFEFINSDASAASQADFRITANVVSARISVRESDNAVLYISANQSRFILGPIGGGVDIEFLGTGSLTVARMVPGGNWRLLDGTAGIPSYSFINDTNIGMFRIGIDTLGWSTTGAERARVDATGDWTFAQGVSTTGSPSFFIFTSAAHTTLTASTEAITADFAFGATVEFATGALATQRATVFRAPTYDFVAASTLTTAATVAIVGAPIAGGAATITNAFAFWVQAGRSQFDGVLACSIDGGFTLTNQTDGAGAGAGTLTNAPAAGDPTIWIPMDINGSTVHVPGW